MSSVDIKLEELIKSVHEIGTQQAVFNERQVTMKEDISSMLTTLKEQNGRIGKIEHWKSRVTGYGSVAVVVVSAGINYAMKKIFGGNG